MSWIDQEDGTMHYETGIYELKVRVTGYMIIKVGDPNDDDEISDEIIDRISELEVSDYEVECVDKIAGVDDIECDLHDEYEVKPWEE